ncbi:ATP-binding protein [Terrimonas sp. NA20]|uniref:histidine kinase n=1 Tax=Terrimonas ginsenosidimutans TaxID=2908004 RepID=A0ABS9KS05_9BACT|nr:ATP-binding protein [Terrimonas ginsenosidimutans]MCG2615077.1 ATP-binding protein [Terrimonas ginsenosidimutans]
MTVEQTPSYDSRQDEIDALKASLAEANEQLLETRYRLEEANDMIEAIRSGEVDALVVKGDNGHQLYTLKSADAAYRIFIEQMTTGAATLDDKGFILYANSPFATLLDQPLEKVAGRFFCDFISSQEAGECIKLMETAWKQPGLQQELALTSSFRKELPVLLSLKPFQLDGNYFMSVIITDLTDQKKQQQLLREKNQQLLEAQLTARDLNTNLEQTVQQRTKELYTNQERLTRILETMAEGVEILDLDGTLTYANPMAQKILGITQSSDDSSHYNNPKWPAFKLDDSPLPDAEHPQAVAQSSGKSVYDFEIGIQPPGRQMFYISINAAPIRDESGNITGSIATFTDVTQRRISIQQKDDFISVASHELRTPITALKASLQLLERFKNDGNPELMHRLIGQSNKSLNKVSILVNDLLDAKKMTEGHLQLNTSDFLIAELVNECCQHVRVGGDFQLVYEGEKNITVHADKDKIDQVLVNFVNNAVKYAPSSKEIRIRVVVDGGFARVTVIDNGPGIASERLPELFKRYYRVHNDGSNISGLGLGLYISAEIIRKHGCEIGVNSQLGRGSEFWFTLPLAT